MNILVELHLLLIEVCGLEIVDSCTGMQRTRYVAVYIYCWECTLSWVIHVLPELEFSFPCDVYKNFQIICKDVQKNPVIVVGMSNEWIL